MAGYCDISDVIQLLPANIAKRIYDPNEFDKPIDDFAIDMYIENASDLIDSAISELYVTPLKKIKEPKRGEHPTDPAQNITYPKPIRLATAQLSAAMVFEKLFSQDSDPNTIPKYAEQYRKDAYKIVNDVRAGAIFIKGQTQTGWRYLNPASKNVNKLPEEYRPWE